MFSFTGLNRACFSSAVERTTRLTEVDTKADQCKALVDKGHIYLTGNGRISMAGLNEKNVRYVAESIDKVVRGKL